MLHSKVTVNANSKVSCSSDTQCSFSVLFTHCFVYSLIMLFWEFLQFLFRSYYMFWRILYRNKKKGYGHLWFWKLNSIQLYDPQCVKYSLPNWGYRVVICNLPCLCSIFFFFFLSLRCDIHRTILTCWTGRSKPKSWCGLPYIGKKIHVRVFGWDNCLKLCKEQVRLFNGRKMLCKGTVLNNINMWPLESWTALQSFISTDKVAEVLKINRNIAGVAGVTESLSCMQKKVIWGKFFFVSAP